jgi:DNA-binding FadR family transcriptional regulator
MDRVYRRIVAELLDDIVTGRIAAGGWLPSIEDIAGRHACSTSAAREAVRALEERRVVEVRPGHGQALLGDDRWMLLDHDVAAAALLRHGHKRLLKDAVDFFQLIETEAAMLAATRVDHGDVTMLAQTLGVMREASHDSNGANGDDDPFAAAEADFHRSLLQLARNRFLASALEELHPVLARARRQRAPDRDPSVIALHERIVSALAERDETAAAAAAHDYGRHLASWLRV